MIIYRLCIPSSELNKSGLGGSLIHTSVSSLDITEDGDTETIDYRIYRGLVRKVSEETNAMFGNKPASSVLVVSSSNGSEGLLGEIEYS